MTPGLLRRSIPKLNKSHVYSKTVRLVIATGVVKKLFWVVWYVMTGLYRETCENSCRLPGDRTRELTYHSTLSDYPDTVTSAINSTKFTKSLKYTGHEKLNNPKQRYRQLYEI